MKKIILLLLLFTTVVLAQPDWQYKSPTFVVGKNIIKRISTGSSYEPEATALFARMTSPSDSEKTRINTLIKSLKDNGVWDSIYVLVGMAGFSTSTNTLLNWKQDTYNPTAVNSPTYVGYTGYKSNGSSSYIRTNFIPSSAGVGQNNIGITITSQTNANQSNAMDMGCYDGVVQIGMYIRDGDKLYSNVNDLGSGSLVQTNSLGHFTVQRNSSAVTYIYQNTSLTYTRTVASTNNLSKEIYVCARNVNGSPNNYTTRVYSFYVIHKGLSTTKITALHNALETYLDAVGIGVIP